MTAIIRRRLVVPVTFYAVGTPKKYETHAWPRLAVARLGAATDTTPTRLLQRRFRARVTFIEALATTPAAHYHRLRLGVSRLAAVGD